MKFYATPSKLFLSVFFVSLFISCEKEKTSHYVKVEVATDSVPPPARPFDKKPIEPNWLNYKILKSQHYNSLENIRFMDPEKEMDSVVFRFAFDSTAIYKNTLPKNQKDWNKLLGFSDCGSHHHNHSARLVWRWDTISKVIEIGEYYYKNRERSYQKMTEMEIGDTLTASILRKAEMYQIIVNGASSTAPRACKTSASSYWLFPYFGGDEPAPQDINVFIQPVYPVLE